MFFTLVRLSWLETTTQRNEFDEPGHVSQDVKLGRLENQESGKPMGAVIGTVTEIGTENARHITQNLNRRIQGLLACRTGVIFYYKTARADNCVEKVTQQWHDRDQTESLNATVDSCFAVIAAPQHSVATSSSD